MLDVAEDSTYPRAKCKPHSLIGVFFSNDWFDWIKIRAVFECFGGVTWPARTPSDLSGVFLAHRSPQKGYDIYTYNVHLSFEKGRSYLKPRVWLSLREIANTAIGIWKLGRWTLFAIYSSLALQSSYRLSPYRQTVSRPTETVSRPTLHGVSETSSLISNWLSKLPENMPE